MKKLGKLSISPEKIMKNEELINLQGGYEYPNCVCTFLWDDGTETTMSGLCGTSSSCSQCGNDLYSVYPNAWSIACEDVL